jgi:hypothetical protein
MDRGDHTTLEKKRPGSILKLFVPLFQCYRVMILEYYYDPILICVSFSQLLNPYLDKTEPIDLIQLHTFS